MQDINNIPKEEIVGLIETGLNLLIKGFQNIGFRPKTNARLEALEKQVALLSKNAIHNNG